MLSPIAHLYGKVADLRNRLYDRRLLESLRLPARTISIGNITAGGTGKTPLVACVARQLADRGEKVCILTRGYGREDPKTRLLVSDGHTLLADAKKAGDEPYELARKLMGKAIVIADAARVEAAEWAARVFDITAFILDDGFQHRRARRDLDIVCIDAMDPFGGGKMLPAGRLREPVHNLARADAIVLTRANLAEHLTRLRSEVEEIAPEAAVFEAEKEISSIRTLNDFEADRPLSVDVHQLPAAFAFCGLGNPESFFGQLRQEGVPLGGTRSFADHHAYKQADMRKLENEARSVGASVLVTTAKDAVKLIGMSFELPVYIVEIQFVIDDPEGFASLLT